MIEINNLSKGFAELEALQDINLQIKKGSIYGLVGSNGAGKTTLLKTIVGVYKGEMGEVKIEGEDIYENERLKAKVIFIPDTLYFFTNYSIQDMANFYEAIYPDWNKDRFYKLGNVFQLDVQKKIHRLSKGMQRQVAFWLALAAMPDYLILDEPLDGLDPVMRQKVKNLLVQDVAEREMTVLISSHNLRELEDLCDSIGLLHQGQLVLERDLDDLKADIHKVQVAFKGEVTEQFLSDFKVFYKEERGSVKIYIVRGNKEALIKAISNYSPIILDILALTLEEIFIYEMGDRGYVIKNTVI